MRSPKKTSNSSKDFHIKKSTVLKSTRYRYRPLLALLLVAAAVSGIYLFMAQNPFSAAAPTLTDVDAVVPNASQATYPVALFNDGKAHHFQHRADGITIRYFILKSSDGVIRAAFDACDVCWPSGKGYVQDGDDMVCRNCGRRFASARINEVKGGCNPAPLNRTVQGELLVIRVEDILNGRNYFNFKESA